MADAVVSLLVVVLLVQLLLWVVVAIDARRLGVAEARHLALATVLVPLVGIAFVALYALRRSEFRRERDGSE